MMRERLALSSLLAIPARFSNALSGNIVNYTRSFEISLGCNRCSSSINSRSTRHLQRDGKGNTNRSSISSSLPGFYLRIYYDRPRRIAHMLVSIILAGYSDAAESCDKKE